MGGILLYSIIIVSSVTYAMKAKELLNNAGIHCRIEKVKKQFVQRGCTHGVIIKSSKLQNAKELLMSERIRIYDILEQEDGT